MTKRTIYAIYRGLIELAAVTVAWLVYDYRAAILTFLALWAVNVGLKYSKFDR